MVHFSKKYLLLQLIPYTPSHHEAFIDLSRKNHTQMEGADISINYSLSIL